MSFEDTSEKQEPKLKELVLQLAELNANINEGRGMSMIRQMIQFLQNGDLDSAKQIALTDGDKLASQPELVKFMKEVLFKDDQENANRFYTL